MVDTMPFLQRQTTTARYWTEGLQISQADLDKLFSLMLENERPLSTLELVRLLVKNRLREEEEVWRRRLAEGVLFQPQNSYAVGQKIVFPALEFALGEVISTRPGSSPEHGEFTVIEVAFEDGVRREFAAELRTPHKLNLAADGSDPRQALEKVDAGKILAEHGEGIALQLEARLRRESDVVYATGQWFLRTLLPEINQGHLNLSEALLDMNSGGPSSAEDLLAILDLPKEIKPELQAFALNYALYQDARFDEVGPAGMARWYLRRLEPDEVRSAPERLVYDPIPYDRTLLSAESRALEAEIGDEFSDLILPPQPLDSVMVTLIYPHRRVGTLPLNHELRALFPTAYESQRIRITLVDGKTGEEFAGWVVPGLRYVYGLDAFYRTYHLPIGAYIRVRRTEAPGRFLLDFDGYRARTEWIRLVMPQNGRITFQNHRRSIGATYDDLMVLGADDLAKVDAIAETVKRHRRSLVELIRDLLPELARLNPQGTAHAKTLYSAVNVLRRCPPGPILAALESQPDFQYVGDHYWRLV